MTKEEQLSFNTRVIWFKVGLVLFAALVVLRLFFISVGQHSTYSIAADSQHGYYQKITPSRGSIFITDKYSPNPYPVATNAHKDLIYAVPGKITDPYGTASILAKILSLDQKEIYEKITTSTKNYLPLKKLLSEEESKAISESKLLGIYLDQENIRYYPEGEFLSQVLGFLGFTDTSADEKIGVYGLEKALQKELAGTPGEITTQTDLKGNWITGSKRDFTPAIDGISLKLTIDRAIQFKTETVVRETVQKHSADSGSIIIADPKTGAIIAMANYPSFDPNNYGKAKDPQVYSNAASLESYEPGSTMKTVTMAAGIDLALVSPTTTYNDTGVVEVAGHKIRNSDGKAQGVVAMTEVINQSLNTGAVFVQQQIGNKRFAEYVSKFGFGKKTGIEIQEAAGNIQNLSRGQQIDFYAASFGQALAATPLQMLQAYMPLANKGKLMQLHLIAAKILPSGEEQKISPKELSQIVSAQTASQISAMLVGNVEKGHGKRAGVKGYFIGGKTGTAQVASGGVYVQNDNIGSFVGYGPIEDPKFVMIVNVSRPRDVSFAEVTAAPAFGELAEFMLNYYGIAPTRK